jgi:3-oxoacyl-ACP reductase-like protein
MLVNRTFYVFLGSTKDCHQIRYSLTDVVLSLSPDHGLFDNDIIYSETASKRSSIVGLQKAGWIPLRRRRSHRVSAAIG